MDINPEVRTPALRVAPAIRAAGNNPKNMGVSVPSSDYEVDLLKWVIMAVQEGDGLLKMECAAEDIDENMAIVSADWKRVKKDAGRPGYRTTYTQSRIGKNINDIASAITDFRPIGDVRTENEDFYNQTKILNKLMKSWWYTMDIDLKMQLLCKQSLVTRTAYAQVVWNPTLCDGLGDIDVIVRDPRDVIPIRPNSKVGIQDALGVVLRSRNTVNWGRARYPEKAEKIQAVNEGGQLGNWASRAMVSSPQLDYLDSQASKPRTAAELAIPTYDHFEIYVRDNSINASKARKWVGPGPEGEHEWGYWVEPGESLYPRGRLIVVANLNVVLYDGGNPYFHGMFPVIKLTLDPWPWTFLGKSAIADCKEDWKAQNEIRQGVFDMIRKALKPGVIANKNTVNRNVLQKFDSSEPGFKLMVNPSAGNGLVLEQPQPLPDYVIGMLDKYDQNIDHVMGVLDMRALAQLQQLSAVDIESLLEHLGPSVRTKGRILEVFLRELGMMMISNFFQFYTVPRRVQILGREGIDFEDFDFDPGNLVPSKTESDPASRGRRAYDHSKNFKYFIAPNSLLSLAKQQDKMMYLQLFRMSVIDAQTLLEKLEIPNIGEMPGNPGTILERMQAAHEMGYEGAVSAAGRKATGQQMPTLRTDGKISESG